jgi:predicted tellurium resistance membrane protein TerC
MTVELAMDYNFSWWNDPEAWIALLTLAFLEIVLGIDNIVFISILVDKLPPSQQPRGRVLGLGLAMVTRIALLFSISWIMSLQEPLFSFRTHHISWKDIILIVGGLFLIFKSTHEIHHKLGAASIIEGDASIRQQRAGAAFGMVLMQIALLDIVFSIDSVITAVGMVQHVTVMALAIVAAVLVMMLCAGFISNFINRNPTIKMLALSFLLLIGTALIAEGFHFEIPKGYIYFAMGFSLMVEMLNIRIGRKRHGNEERPAD